MVDNISQSKLRWNWVSVPCWTIHPIILGRSLKGQGGLSLCWTDFHTWDEKEHWKKRCSWVSFAAEHITHWASTSIPNLRSLSLVDKLPRTVIHWIIDQRWTACLNQITLDQFTTGWGVLTLLRAFQADFMENLPFAVRFHTTKSSWEMWGVREAGVLLRISLVTAFLLLGHCHFWLVMIDATLA